MFQIEELKAQSRKKFEEQLRQHWISDTFADCIRDVYSTSKERDLIRKAIVDAVSVHRELIQKRIFQELIREVGDFAVDLVLIIAGVKVEDFWA